MAGKRVSQYIILRETGWTPIDAPIICAKLGLHERIKKQDTREYAATVLAERMQAVREGDTKGLCYEVRELWRKLGAAERWDGAPSENAQDKQERKQAVVALVEEEMEIWIQQHSEENGDYETLADHAPGEPAWHTH